MARRSWGRLVLAATLAPAACGPGGPVAPRPVPSAAREPAAGTILVAGQNVAPTLLVRTTPPADPSTSPFPTISGDAPLRVKFNLCRSEDPDVGDSLNYQFHFGDSGRPAFDADGAFDPDFDHFCRTEHVYERPGDYTATVSVTDKHLDDQSHDVVALARRTQSFTIVVAVPQPPTPKPEGTPGPGPEPTPTPAPLPPRVISIVNHAGAFSYSPNPASARVGQRVIWVNVHDLPHTATADGGAFDTGFLAPGASSGAITVGSAGSFPYHCDIHPSMVGTLRVTP